MLLIADPDLVGLHLTSCSTRHNTLGGPSLAPLTALERLTTLEAYYIPRRRPRRRRRRRKPQHVDVAFNMFWPITVLCGA